MLSEDYSIVLIEDKNARSRGLRNEVLSGMGEKLLVDPEAMYDIY